MGGTGNEFKFHLAKCQNLYFDKIKRIGGKKSNSI
jgi:hypothetical protein